MHSAWAHIHLLIEYNWVVLSSLSLAAQHQTPRFLLLFYNFLSCLVSHPDETLRKRLKEKRKGGLCFCSLLHLTTAPISTLVCMNEHETCELCLSTVTHRSANTWPTEHHFISLFNCCQTLRRTKQTEHQSSDVCVNVHLGSAARNVCSAFIMNEEWIPACSNYFSCSINLLSSSSNSNSLLYSFVSQTSSVCILGPVL